MTSNFPAAIPTPPASSIAPSTTTSHHPSPLPQPRRHPLRPGGPKEGELITYLDHNVNDIQKRVDNRVQQWNKTNDLHGRSRGGGGGLEGYKNFAEVEKDVEGLVDVVWVSGSPNLQIPYLLNIATLITEHIPLFPPAPHSTFRLLSKLDMAFSSLLQGRDLDTDAPLPGFENGRTISTTDKVRLKGVVDRARLVVVRKLGGFKGGDADGEEGTDTEMEMETDTGGDRDEGLVKFEGFEGNDEDEVDGMEGDREEDEERWEVEEVGRVFERTIAGLGDVLGGPPIGIISDD